MASFRPTHAVPATGLDSWSQPDPGLAAGARLDPWLPVEVVTTTGGWAEVRCANDWVCWVDAAALVPTGAPPLPPVPPVPAAGGPGPSAGGYPAGGYPAGGFPAAGFPSTPAYAGGRGTRPGSAGMAVRVIGTAVGAGVVVLGGYLTWLRVAGTTGVSGKDIPAQVLVDMDTTATGPVSIAGLLIGLAVIAVLASLWRPVSFVRRLAGLAAMATAALFGVQTLRAVLAVPLGTPGAPNLFSSLGIGVAVAFAGGLLILLVPKGGLR